MKTYGYSPASLATFSSADLANDGRILALPKHSHVNYLDERILVEERYMAVNRQYKYPRASSIVT